jgi:hypothetical protein
MQVEILNERQASSVTTTVMLIFYEDDEFNIERDFMEGVCWSATPSKRYAYLTQLRRRYCKTRDLLAIKLPGSLPCHAGKKHRG